MEILTSWLTLLFKAGEEKERAVPGATRPVFVSERVGLANL